LLKLAAICPAALTEVLRQNPTLANDQTALSFLTHSVAVDAVSLFATFKETPRRLLDLAIFLRSQSGEGMKQKIYVQYLGRTLYSIWLKTEEQRHGSTDLESMIGCVKVLVSLIRYDSGNQGKFPYCELLFSHFYIVAAAVAQTIIASPIYPHFQIKTPEAFFLRSAFDDLAFACIQKFRHLLTVLLNCDPTPGGVLLLASGLETIDPEQHRRTSFLNIFILNLSELLRFGFSILKIPNEHTTTIAARFYLSLVKITRRYRIGSHILYELLEAPMLLVEAVGKIAPTLDPITESTTWCQFLGFLEKILVDPTIKSFLILEGRKTFWRPLTQWTAGKRVGICCRVGARVFRIFAKLSDYSKSLKNCCPGGQRIVFDCLPYGIVRRLCRSLNSLGECGNANRNERGVLAMSALELIVALCDPLPLAAFVGCELEQRVVDWMERIGAESGEPFAGICHEFSSVVRRKLDRAVVEGDSGELIRTQQAFQEYGTGSARRCGLFMKVLCGLDVPLG
jgi:hypothetical protein